MDQLLVFFFSVYSKNTHTHLSTVIIYIDFFFLLLFLLSAHLFLSHFFLCQVDEENKKKTFKQMIDSSCHWSEYRCSLRLFLNFTTQAGALPRVTSTTALDRSSLKEKCPFLIVCHSLVSCRSKHTHPSNSFSGKKTDVWSLTCSPNRMDQYPFCHC